MASLGSVNGFRFFQSMHGGMPVCKKYWTASNLSFGIGDAVAMDANGYLCDPTATSVAVFGFSVETITGVAATRQQLNIIPALPGYVFIARTSGNTNVTQAYIGDQAGLTTSTYNGIDLTATTGAFKIIGVAPTKGNVIPNTNVELLVIVNESSFTGIDQD